MEKYIIPFAEDDPVEWTFVQYGALFHRSGVSKTEFHDNSISMLQWPSYSLELNPIENMWDSLV